MIKNEEKGEGGSISHGYKTLCMGQSRLEIWRERAYLPRPSGRTCRCQEASSRIRLMESRCLQPKPRLKARPEPEAGDTQEFGLCRRDVSGAGQGEMDEQLQTPCRGQGTIKSTDQATRGRCWARALLSEEWVLGWHVLPGASWARRHRALHVLRAEPACASTTSSSARQAARSG